MLKILIRPSVFTLLFMFIHSPCIHNLHDKGPPPPPTKTKLNSDLLLFDNYLHFIIFKNVQNIKIASLILLRSFITHNYIFPSNYVHILP